MNVVKGGILVKIHTRYELLMHLLCHKVGIWRITKKF